MVSGGVGEGGGPADPPGGRGGSGGPGHPRPGHPPAKSHGPLTRGSLGRTEHLYPPPGFYELSDGGSCSLSTSCTSVCSDHVSCSLGTLLPAAPKARPGSGDCRPRSADETAVCGVPLPAWGPLASEEGPGQLLQEEPRPRPVSTGEESRAVGDPPGPRAPPPEEVRSAPSSHPGGPSPDLPSTEQEALCLWGGGGVPPQQGLLQGFHGLLDGQRTQRPASVHRSRAVVMKSTSYLK